MFRHTCQIRKCTLFFVYFADVRNRIMGHPQEMTDFIIIHLTVTKIIIHLTVTKLSSKKNVLHANQATKVCDGPLHIIHDTLSQFSSCYIIHNHDT